MPNIRSALYGDLQPASQICTFTEAQNERFLNLDSARLRLEEIHRTVAISLQANRERARKSAKRADLPRFTEVDFVLIAQYELFEGEKLALRWQGPRRVIQALSDLVFTVDNLRNGTTDDIHACRLRFYYDKALDTKAILPHVLSSERRMPIARLMRLEEHDDELLVHLRWRGLSNSEDTLEPLQVVYEDVPKLVPKLLARKSLPKAIVVRAKNALKLTSSRGV